MTEPMVIVTLTLGGLLWMAGGTWWKGLRRIVLPVFYAMIAMFSGVSIHTAILAGVVTVIVNSLPYGDLTPLPVKMLVFGSLATPAMVINLNLWPAVLASSLVLTLLFLASQKWNQVTHKIFEGFCGFTQSSAIVVALLWR